MNQQPNPYTPASSDLFYGRSELMRELLKNEQSGQSIVLLGGRRCGKTVVLRRLEQVLLELAGDAQRQSISEIWQRLVDTEEKKFPRLGMRVHWPISVNYQGAQVASLANALDLIVRGAAESLDALRKVVQGRDGEETTPSAPTTPVERTRGTGHLRLVQELEPSVRTTSVERIEDILADRPDLASLDTLTLEAWLKRLDALLVDLGLSGIALLVDEVEEVFDQPWCHELMGFLRRLDDTTFRTRIWIILVGVDGLDRYHSPKDGSPPLNTTRRVLLDDLDYRERWRMCAEPFVRSGHTPPDDASLKAIDALAGGNVWLLTLILERLFASEDHASPPPGEVADDVMDEHRDLFQRWARPFDDTAWELYKKLASQGILEADHFKTDGQKDARQLFRYQALCHFRKDRRLEIGPELFCRWAEANGKIQGPFGPPHREPEGEANAPGRYRYDVAISFAGPQRKLAERLADLLHHQQHLKVFYDEHQSQGLWGVDLDQHLPTIYGRDCRIAVLLLSKDYVKRHWPQVEQKAALTRAIQEGWDGILLVSTDGTRLQEIPDSIVIRDLTAEGTNMERVALELGGLLIEKRE